MAEGGQRPARFEPKVCASCGAEFRAMNPAAKYCSPACRAKGQAARSRRRKQGGPSAVDVAADDPSPWEEGR